MSTLQRRQADLAITSYQQAIDVNPHHAAYYYNLYRAYSQENFLSGKVDGAFQKGETTRSKTGRILYLDRHSPPNMNRLVVDEVLRPQRLWARFLNNSLEGKEFSFVCLRHGLKRIPSRIHILVPLFFLGFLVGMSKYMRIKRFLTRCPMCGSPTHRFYLGNSNQEYFCFNCYRVYMQKEKLHPKIAEKKSLQAEQFQRQNHFLGQVSLLLFYRLSGPVGGAASQRAVFSLCLFYFYPKVCLPGRGDTLLPWPSPPSPGGI